MKQVMEPRRKYKTRASLLQAYPYAVHITQVDRFWHFYLPETATYGWEQPYRGRKKRLLAARRPSGMTGRRRKHKAVP